MKKFFKDEITKNTFGTLIGLTFSLFIASIGGFYVNTNKIFELLDTKVEYFTELEHKINSFDNNLDVIFHTDSLSRKRTITLMDSVLKNESSNELIANDLLQYSLKNQFAVADNIGTINSLPELNEFSIDNNKLIKLFINFLNSEREIWASFDSYLITLKQNNLKDRDLAFNELDYNLNNYYLQLNTYSAFYKKTLNERELKAIKIQSKNQKLENNILKSKRIQRLCLIGIFISIILIVPLLGVTFKVFKKKNSS